MNATLNFQGATSLPLEHINEYFIQAKIVFGDPGQINCSGIGICRLLPSDLRRSPDIGAVPVALFVSPSGGIELRFRRSDLPETLYNKQFSGGFFRVQTALRLPRWLLKKLPLNAPFFILPGNYAYREKTSFLTIVLP